MTIYERALEFVQDGDVVGLGSGRASMAFIQILGERVKAGLKVRGVPTSRISEELAHNLRIPLVSLAEGMPLAVTVDGADEVAPDLVAALLNHGVIVERLDRLATPRMHDQSTRYFNYLDFLARNLCAGKRAA